MAFAPFPRTSLGKRKADMKSEEAEPQPITAHPVKRSRITSATNTFFSALSQENAQRSQEHVDLRASLISTNEDLKKLTKAHNAVVQSQRAMMGNVDKVDKEVKRLGPAFDLFSSTQKQTNEKAAADVQALADNQTKLASDHRLFMTEQNKTNEKATTDAKAVSDKQTKLDSDFRLFMTEQNKTNEKATTDAKAISDKQTKLDSDFRLFNTEQIKTNSKLADDLTAFMTGQTKTNKKLGDDLTAFMTEQTNTTNKLGKEAEIFVTGQQALNKRVYGFMGKQKNENALFRGFMDSQETLLQQVAAFMENQAEFNTRLLEKQADHSAFVAGQRALNTRIVEKHQGLEADYSAFAADQRHVNTDQQIFNDGMHTFAVDCVREAFSSTQAAHWTKHGIGKSACLRCVKSHSFCFQQHHGLLLVLPLPYQVRVSEDPRSLSYWRLDRDLTRDERKLWT